MSILQGTHDYHAPSWSRGPWKMLVGANWITSGQEREILDPGTNQVIASVPESTAENVDAAVDSARASFDSGAWRDLPVDQRSEILWRIGNLIDERADELSVLESLNMGGPHANTRRNLIPESARVFRYYAGWVDKIGGRSSRLRRDALDIHAYTTRTPIGVAALITPWNSPLLMAAWKVAPALAAGCSCVLKPAELTPLTALVLGEIALAAGLPPGALNIVTGDGAVAGAHLSAHPDVDKVAFTGSTEVGRAIIGSAAGNLKKVSLELGGKSPVVIFDDADVDAAAAGAATAIFANSGQICTAGSRLLVQDGIYESVLQRVGKIAAERRLGYAFDPRVEMGPVISRDQLETVQGYVAAGLDEGATLVAGGEAASPGNFIEPTVLGNARPGMKVVDEEIFGPVVAAMPFSDAGDAIRLANNSTYGLAASVWTRDVKRAHHVAHSLRAGRVGINIHGLADVTMPTGGFKQSGWGRELGPEGLDVFLETTSVFLLMNERS